MRKIIKASDSDYRDYLEMDKDAEQREVDDRRLLKTLKQKMQEIFDILDSTRRNFVRDYDLGKFYEELGFAIREIAYDIEPFNGVEGSTRITAVTGGVKIPAPLSKYYRVATKADLDSFGDDIDEDKSPCEECKGYDAKNVGYAIAKDKYTDALANDGLDLVELVKFGDDSEVKLAYAVHDRIYTLDEDEIKDIVG